MNTTMHKTLIDGYNAKAYTHEYMFGFADRGNVYVCKASAEMLPFITTLDRTSSKRGGEYCLRFKPTRAMKELLKTCECFVLCSEEFFKAECAESKYNKGEIFEKLVTEHFEQTWTKDSVPFTEDGDLTVDGIAYQLKFDKATFCTEKSLRNL